MGEKSAGAAYSRAPLVLSVSPQPTFHRRKKRPHSREKANRLAEKSAEGEGPFLTAVGASELPGFEFFFHLIQTEILAPRWT